MEHDDFDSYLNERYYPQVNWYDEKAIWNQKIYKQMQWGIIVLAALTPILVVIGGVWERWLAVIVSVLVAIGTAGLKTFNYQENWINYRSTCEALRKEIHYYNSKIDSYEKADDSIALFVKRVEALLSRENTMWLTVHNQKEEDT